MDLLDIATIRDVRTGQYAKKPKVCNPTLLELLIPLFIKASLTECDSINFICSSRIKSLLSLKRVTQSIAHLAGSQTAADRYDGVAGYARGEDRNRVLRF